MAKNIHYYLIKAARISGWLLLPLTVLYIVTGFALCGEYGVSEVIRGFAPQAVAVEELYSHYERPRTAILMGHARGVICLSAAEADIPVCHYAATHVKKMLTGSGRAPKDQVQLAVCREFQLAAPPEPHDVADALAIALCHCFASRELPGASSSSRKQAS